MKNFLFPLLLFPLISKAQLIEMSASAGYVFTNALPRVDNYYYNVVKNRYALAASLSASVKLPYNFRVGVAAVRYRFGNTVYEDGCFSSNWYNVRVDPVLLELMMVSRNKFGRFTLDLGVVGGVAVQKRICRIITDGSGPDVQMRDPGQWYTYGLIGTASYGLSKRLAIGLETQPKVFVANMDPLKKSAFVLPVMAKVTVKI